MLPAWITLGAEEGKRGWLMYMGGCYITYALPPLLVMDAGQTKDQKTGKKKMWQGKPEPRSHYAVRSLRPHGVCSWKCCLVDSITASLERGVLTGGSVWGKKLLSARSFPLAL